MGKVQVDALTAQFALVFAQIELRGTDGLKGVTTGWDVARDVRL